MLPRPLFNVSKAPVHSILKSVTDPKRKGDPAAIVLACLSGNLLAAFMAVINVVKTEVKLPKGQPYLYICSIVASVIYHGLKVKGMPHFMVEVSRWCHNFRGFMAMI